MKRVMLPFIVGGLFSLAIASSCSNNASSAKEPEVTKMDSIKDSLKVAEEKVNDDIEKVQKSLQDVDKEFKN